MMISNDALSGFAIGLVVGSLIVGLGYLILRLQSTRHPSAMTRPLTGRKLRKFLASRK